MKKARAKICPKCGSANIASLYWLGDTYECKDCGFRGPAVVKEFDKKTN